MFYSDEFKAELMKIADDVAARCIANHRGEPLSVADVEFLTLEAFRVSRPEIEEAGSRAELVAELARQAEIHR